MRKKSKNKPAKFKDNRLFTLEVFLFSGNVSEEFLKNNKVVSRTIEIRGDQTLEDLHKCIFDAFNRFDEHMYEFQFGGKGPDDPKAKRYVLPAVENKCTAGDLTKTRIGSIGLKADDTFGYVFDYGDNWQHQIDVIAIADTTPAGKYPRVIKCVGESPPQYMDWDQEENWEDEDEFEESSDEDIFTGEKVTVPLSAEQRDLLISIKKVIDNEIVSLVSDGKKITDQYEIVMTDEQINSLIGSVIEVFNNEKNKKRRADLHLLSDYLIEVFERATFGWHETADDDNSDIPVIDLTNFSRQPLKIDHQALDFLHNMVDEIERMCRISGIRIDKFLDSYKPTLIKPHEKIDVRLTSESRKLLCSLPQMHIHIAAQIRWTPHEKQNVRLTLSQINELENIVAIASQEATDKNLKRQLGLIDQELISIQIKYTDKDGTASRGPQLAISGNISRGEIIRNLMTNMLNERKNAEKEKHGKRGRKK